MDLQKAYEKCFQCILTILTDPHEKADVESILQNQLSWVEEGKIQRQEVSPHFVTYCVPKELSQGKIHAFLEIPRFNEPLSERLPFWPQVRNRMDAQKIQLVGIETDKGVHYDLWYPGYAWAETKGLWLPPGLLHSNSLNHHKIQWPALENVIQELNDLETGSCSWKLFSSLSFSGEGNPRRFPIVASTLNERDEKEESYLPLKSIVPVFEL